MFVVCKYMLFGGWMVVGWYMKSWHCRADEREEGRAGGRERERRYLCVCIYSGEKREERSYRERYKGREFILPCNVSQQQHQLKQLPSTHQNIHIYPSRYTQQSGQTPSSRVDRFTIKTFLHIRTKLPPLSANRVTVQHLPPYSLNSIEPLSSS